MEPDSRSPLARGGIRRCGPAPGPRIALPPGNNNKGPTVSTTRAKSILSALLLGVAATFGGTGSAQAAIYTGNWDPAYGGIFPGLGWSATAHFDVPGSCLALGNTNNIPDQRRLRRLRRPQRPGLLLRHLRPGHDPRVVQPGPGRRRQRASTSPAASWPASTPASSTTSSRRLATRRRRRVFVQPAPVRRQPGAADLRQSARRCRPAARFCRSRRQSAASRQILPSARSRPPFPSPRRTC